MEKEKASSNAANRSYQMLPDAAKVSTTEELSRGVVGIRPPTSRRVAVVLGGGYNVRESRFLVSRTTKDNC